jgi:hypothetical protein
MNPHVAGKHELEVPSVFRLFLLLQIQNVAACVIHRACGLSVDARAKPCSDGYNKNRLQTKGLPC